MKETDSEKNKPSLAETRFQESNLEFLQKFLDSIFAIAILGDRNGTVLAVNEAMEASIGKHRDQLIGRNLFSFLPPPASASRTEKFHELLEKKSILHFFDRRDGRDFENRIFPILDDEGEVAYAVLIAREITGQIKATQLLSESNQRFEALAGHISDPIFLTDENGHILHVNSKSCEKYGYTYEEFYGMHITEVIYDPTCTKSVKGWLDLAPGTTIQTPTIHRKKDGTSFPVDLNGGIILWENKKASLAVVRDMTHWLAQEEQRVQARKAESLSILSAGIANDFKNLLFTIIGNITLARESRGDPSQSDFLQEALQSCEHAQELIRDFTTLAGSFQPKKAPGAIDKLLEKVIRDSLRGSRVSAQVESEAGLWPLSYDSSQIEIVIRNLLQNAVEAVAGRGTVRILVENSGPDHPLRKDIAIPGERYVSVTFHDNGRGMHKAESIRIFDPYFSSKQATDKKGLGLGLSVALALVRKHGGEIRVDSVKEKGTAATFFLPAD